MAQSTRNWREDLKTFRERMGGLSEEKKTRTKAQKAAIKAIQLALKNGPRTVPEIAAESGLPSHTVLWYIMAMKRYSMVAEAGDDGDYYRYQLKEASA